MEYIKTAHSVYWLQYHVVWVCKYRRRILNPGVCRYRRRVLIERLRRMPGVELETIGFAHDHLHMVVVIPPRYRIAAVMGKLQRQLASRLREKCSWLEQVYWKEKIVWSPGFFVSSVGVDEETIKRYVEYQGAQDSGQLRMQL